MHFTRGKVQAALRAESKRFDGKHRGVNVFSPIWEEADVPGCNWSASFQVIGSGLDLSEMRAALERVQSRMPTVKF